MSDVLGVNRDALKMRVYKARTLLCVSLAHLESKCSNFYDPAEVERVFYPEIEKLAPHASIVQAKTYYGGGEWLLLTALLGLAEPEHGQDRLDWIAAHATPDGGLPEQVQDHLLHPQTFDEWVAKWGPPPSPLLWSHAMFLTLAHAEA